MSSVFAPTRPFPKCLFRAKHCYSSKLAEHQSGEGRGFLMIVDFFPSSVKYMGGKVCFKVETRFKTSKSGRQLLSI